MRAHLHGVERVAEYAAQELFGVDVGSFAAGAAAARGATTALQKGESVQRSFF